MYYNEKWENGIFYIKTSLNGEWKKKVPSLYDLESAFEEGKISFFDAIHIAVRIHENKY